MSEQLKKEHNRYLTAREAWAFLGCGQRTFRRLTAMGELRQYAMPYGARFKLSDLVSWAENHKESNG